MVDEYKFDIRAEVLAAYLLKNNRHKKVVISPTLDYRQGFSEDIAKLKASNDTTDIEVRRLGFVGQLPEGAFVQLPEEGTDSQKAAMVAEQVIATKKFFRPFDQYLNNSRIEIEQWEQSTPEYLMEQILTLPDRSGEMDVLFTKVQLKRLKALLPFIPDIVGNLELTGFCLSLILEDQISLQPTVGGQVKLNQHSIKGLEEMRLGIDSVLDSFTYSDDLEIAVEVGPLSLDRLGVYLPLSEEEKEEAEGIRKLNYLLPIMLPLENWAKIHILVEDADTGLKLTGSEVHENSGRLAFTSVI